MLRLFATIFPLLAHATMADPSATPYQVAQATDLTFTEIDLYQGDPPGGVPLSEKPESIYQKDGDPIVRVDHVQKPSLRIYAPAKDKNTGAACVIYPGGGYGILAIDHEGYQIAKWFTSIGITGIVCKYRVSRDQQGLYKHPIPLLDARQAVRLTRQHAAQWGIDPKKVGVLGFSAGGHLASCVDTLFDLPLPGEDEASFKRMEHKPDWAALIYPVTSLSASFAHKGSAVNLLGKDPDPKLLEQLDTFKQVSPNTPPTFLVATQEDKAVPAENSIAFYQAMAQHGVKGELHVWQKGPHGFGILPSGGDVSAEWPVRLHKWLAGLEIVKK